MPKHTPGPWEWCETESGIYGNVRRSVHKGVEHVNREQVFPFFDSDRTSGLHGQRHEADKRLIAAAPDLLEAMRYVQSWMEDCLMDKQMRGLPSREAYEVTRAAIAKASGE